MTLVLNENISKAAQKDILELQKKISQFKKGEIQEERFKAFRLARGVYGQRQLGVQMFRIKLPYGKVTGEQLTRIADVSEEYTNGNLHTTTRQNIQLHFVHLEDTPEMWAKLEEKGITTKEACGNTVRNITASPLAGIDPDEPFDVAPYAHAVFEYFLRNPINQEMGRKIKIAFSSSDKDAAFTYIHDFGFIPRIKDGQRGFKVVVGGGLGAQTFIAETAYEFLSEDKIIPFIETGLRVFDRYGEREKRHKARMKFLVEAKRGLGLEKFMELISIEQKANAHHSLNIDTGSVPVEIPKEQKAPEPDIKNKEKYKEWLQTNVLEQKQKGFYAIKIRLPLGNIHAGTARELVNLTKGYIADDIRITISQGLLLKFARKENLPYLFYVLDHLGLAEPGSESIVDITACPGTDTCNLAVTNSTGIAEELERMISSEFHSLITDSDIHIKISGCMNSCGQHMIANIGFHGSSIKNGSAVIPALQVVLGGGVDEYGRGFIADKVIKLPTKKIPEAVRILLKDYEAHSEEGEYFNYYYLRQGKMYFYNLLKPLGDLTALGGDDYLDWGETEAFVPEIGTGECAGVSYDMVGTILQDAEERLHYGGEALENGYYADSIYHSYSTFVITAKALLLSIDIQCNTHIGIIKDFAKHFDGGLGQDFEAKVLQINQNIPEPAFATDYLEQARAFFREALALRTVQALESEKEVISNYYKA
ncbi:Ferredoxin--sulfite reductase [Fulvivirga imtechensis AK7]|uniref:Ferredoxin--sulfite reductase n=1 Tax=Fulvivirga imtechensis AK7 TaxID=1237149 RepID=L8JNX1_9BACT|nr:HEPN domain-containing protein [Fulvivirga imtechensis]ELR69077.1 Ferredoxin--sulfite reductase [Fulvivirga imtechensis AK7]